MPRGVKKTEEAAVETTVQAVAETQPTATAADLEKAVVKLGLRMCKDFEDGIVRPEATLVNALTDLFKAVKG